MTPKERHLVFEAYDHWVRNLPVWWLRNMVIDAFWKGHFKGSTPDETHELERYFRLENEKGIKMVPRL